MLVKAAGTLMMTVIATKIILRNPERVARAASMSAHPGEMAGMRTVITMRKPVCATRAASTPLRPGEMARNTLVCPTRAASAAV